MDIEHNLRQALIDSTADIVRLTDDRDAARHTIGRLREVLSSGSEKEEHNG